MVMIKYYRHLISTSGCSSVFSEFFPDRLGGSRDNKLRTHNHTTGAFQSKRRKEAVISQQQTLGDNFTLGFLFNLLSLSLSLALLILCANGFPLQLR